MSKLSRRTVLKVVAGAGASATVFTRGSARAQSQPIKLPFFTTLTGPVAPIGVQSRKGAEIAAKIVNANGGVNGRTIELVFFDDQANANGMIAAAREAASLGLGYISGGLISGYFPAVVPVLEETDTVWIAGTGSNMALANEAFNRRVFPGSENDLQRALILARLAADKFPDVKSWGANVNEVQSYISGYNNFKTAALNEYQKNGKSPKFADPVATKIGTSDFRSVLNDLATSDYDGLYYLMLGGDAATFWKQAKPFDLGSKFNAVIDVTLDMSLLKALKNDMPPNLWNLNVWTPSVHNKTSKMSKAFYDEYVAQTGDTLPSAYLQYGAHCVLAFVAAMKQTGGKTDSSSFMDALESVHFDNLKDDTYYRKEDHMMMTSVAVQNVVADPNEKEGVRIVDAVAYRTEDLSPPPNPGKPYKK